MCAYLPTVPILVEATCKDAETHGKDSEASIVALAAPDDYVTRACTNDLPQLQKTK